MADLRGSVLKGNGGQVTVKYGGARQTSTGNSLLRKESLINGEQSISNVNKPSQSDVKTILDFKHGGNENDNADTFVSWDDIIAIKNCPTSVSADDVGQILDPNAMGSDNIEWITTSVDSLGRVVFSPLDLQSGAADIENGTVESAGNVDSPMYADPLGDNTKSILINTDHTSVPTSTLQSSVDHLFNASISQVNSTHNTSNRKAAQSQGVSLLQTKVINLKDNGVTNKDNKAQDLVSQGQVTVSNVDTSFERFISTDRTLDEIGAILTQDESGLFDSSKKELATGLQSIDFQDLDTDRSGLFTAQGLEDLPDFDEGDNSDLKPCFSNIVIQNIPDVSETDARILESALPASTKPDTTVQNVAASTASTPHSVSVTSITSEPTTAPQGNVKQPANSQDTLQIVLYDDEGKEHVINISQTAIRDSINKFRAKDGNSTNSANDKAVVNLSSVTVQDGFLVIPVDATTAENLPDSVDNIEPLVRTVPKQGLGNSVPKQWMCYLCGKVYARLSKLKVHIMQHTGERPFKCTYKGCKWAFTVAHKLRRHMERHTGTKHFQCDEEGCGKRFTTVYNLRTHKKIHSKPCTEVCNEPGCGKAFRSRRLLDIHMSKVHNIISGCYPCPQPGCDRTFTSPYCIGSHMRVHQRAELVCSVDGCGKQFTKKCRLLQHIQQHTGERPFKCPAEGCKWAFCSSSKLRRHMHKHTNQRQFVCEHEGCGKRFLRSEHLKGHLITHTGLKPFSCPEEGCSAKFSSKSSMYVHVKRHKQLAQAANLMKELDAQKAVSQAPDNTKVVQLVNISKQGTLQVTPASLAQKISLPSGKSVTISQITKPPLQLAASSAKVTQASTTQHVFEQAPVVLSSPQQLSVTSVMTASPSGMLSVPIVITPDLANMSQDVVNVGGLSLSAGPTGLGSLTPTLASSVKPIAASQAASQTATYGRSARTDPHTNELLCEKARRRRQCKTQTAATSNNLGTTEVTVMPASQTVVSSQSPRQPYESSHGLSGSSSLLTHPHTVNPNEIMTSRAITFRDPETGAITIQTQLLQDDPPDVYAEDPGSASILGGASSLDGSDLASMLMETHQADLNESLSVAVEYGRGASELDSTSSVFTGTTINLQDLE